MSNLARSSDPISSHVAGNEAAAFKAAHYTEIIKLLEQYPNQTAQEIATHSDLDRYQIGRRLKELETRGQIQRVAIRTCSVGNRIATTWELKA
jgi:DNA-binding MarR family transcriptional regulator